ncbi:hypothetical protein [Streptacidiphilus cavernicola]|uniref:XRE family transcriptional regulator n=1 Tax=Streptacidiphilus cavernicola TaxID=3342716 RepID=A0ABV6W5J6_9ACTN
MYPDAPWALPSYLLADPRLLDAGRRRDIGAIFALAKGEDISFNQLATASGLPAERVGRLARGEGEITSLPVLERVSDGLRIPGGVIGLAPRPWERAPAPAHRPPCQAAGEDDPMNRREVLRGALAAGIAAPGLAALARTRHSIDAALTDHASPDLSYWEGTAERYSYGYNGQAPTAVLADLAADFQDMSPLFELPQTVANRARLSHIAAEMAGMTAIVLHDLGQHRDAHAWFNTAGLAAQESGDNRLYAWVLAREAMVPLNFGAPQAAAALAARARHAAGDRPSAFAALASAVAARAYAAQGRRDDALEAVDHVEGLIDQLDNSATADTWFGYPEQKHHVHLSQALTLLGETGRAYTVQERALELSRSPSLMVRALIAIDHASCLVHEAHPDEAAGRAAQAYGELPAAYRTGLTRTRAEALYRQLPAKTRGLDVLRDALAS